MMKHWIITTLLSICGLAIPATITARLGDRDNWAFGPRSVDWVYGDGKPVPRDHDPLYRWDGCRPNDIGFATLRHDGALWTVCDDPEGDGNAGMARIDPDARVGTIWRFPEDLPHAATRGIAVTPSGIAIVYWTPDIHENLAVAVIDRTGWKMPATLLPDSSGADVMAASHARGRLEVIYEPSRTGSDALADRMPILATVESGSVSTKRFPAPPECGDRCMYPCRLLLRQDRWRVWIPAIDPAGSLKMIESSEHREHRVVDDVALDRWCNTREHDRAALGVTEIAAAVALRTEDARAQSIDGELRGFAPPPDSSWQPASVYSWLEPAPIGLQRHMMWEAGFGWARPHGDGWLVLSTQAHANEELAATVFDERGKPQQTRVIARAPSYFGGNLQIGVPLQRPDGGFWLVSQNGYYIAVGDDLERLDPLPVFEHLRARGSLNPEWDETQHIYKFLWTLVGLPVCLLLATGIAFARRKSIGHAMAWGAAVFVVTGGWCLVGVYPLLF